MLGACAVDGLDRSEFFIFPCPYNVVHHLRAGLARPWPGQIKGASRASSIRPTIAARAVTDRSRQVHALVSWPLDERMESHDVLAGRVEQLCAIAQENEGCLGATVITGENHVLLLLLEREPTLA